MKTSSTEPPKVVYYREKNTYKVKYLTWDSIRPKSVKKTSLLNPIECYSLSSPRPVKNPCNSIRYRRSAVDWEDLKPYWKSEKNPHFSRWSAIILLLSSSKTLLIAEKILTGLYFLTVNLSQTFLNTGTTSETFQQSGKKTHIEQLKRLIINKTHIQTHIEEFS